MAYIVPADLRDSAVKWYTRGIRLTDDEAPDAELTGAIAEMSKRFDQWTDDRYEPETALAVTVDVDPGTGARLFLPKRVRSVTEVATIDLDGTVTVEDSDVYRVHSSLTVDGLVRVGRLDWLQLIPGKSLSTGGWPQGQRVRVTGNWNWAATPDRVRRAIALLVWDHFRPQGDNLRRAQRWATEQASFDASLTEPSGIPEVDAVVAELRRGTDTA